MSPITLLLSIIACQTDRIVWLDTLPLGPITQDWGIPQRDRQVNGRVLSINGRQYDRGVGMHANALWTFKIAGKAKNFFGTFGGDDSSQRRGSIQLALYGDGRLLLRSPILRGGPPIDFQVNLTGVSLFEIRILNGGDNINHDAANLVEAGFVMTDKDTIPEGIWPQPKSGESWFYPEPYDLPFGKYPRVTLPLLFISTADDDGSNARNFSPYLIPGIVRYLNKAFESANITFVCDPKRDFLSVKSTLLNRDFLPSGQDVGNRNNKPVSTENPHGPARDRLAWQYPDRFVIVMRRGSHWEWSETKNQWIDKPSPGNYGGGYILSGAMADDPGMFAHEIGHSLGLPHTFSSQPKSIAEISSELSKALTDGQSDSMAASIYDGDKEFVKDTPPDPLSDTLLLGGTEFRKKPVLELTVSDGTGQARVIRFAPDPYNIMSYRSEGRGMHPRSKEFLGRFSPDQAAILSRRAEQRFDDQGQTPDHSRPPRGLRIRFKDMLRGGTYEEIQVHGNPSYFARPDGIAGEHLRISTRLSGRYGFTVEDVGPGRYRVWFSGVYAPENGIVDFFYQGEKLRSFDSWCVNYAATGWRVLGEVSIKTKSAKFVIECSEKHPKSRGFNVGLDSLVFERLADGTGGPKSQFQREGSEFDGGVGSHG